MLDLPPDAEFLLAALPPSRRQRLLALAVALCAIAVGAAALPFATMALPFFAPFFAVMQSLIMEADLVVAVLLYAQFAILGWRSLLWLAGCYLYTALVCVAHYLSYPGVVSPGGALGAQATGWLFVAWQGALPVAVIFYALRQSEDRGEFGANQPTRATIALNAATMVALSCGTVGLAMLASAYLPALFSEDGRHITLIGEVVNRAMAPLLVGALVLLWTRQRSVLDLWLMAILVVWLITNVYSALAFASRFTVGFYVFRAYWLVTALLILVVLLSETTTLYARLAYNIVLSRRQRVMQAVAVDAMSASFAHELSQPVAAMVANGEAAMLWLSKTPPDLHKTRISLEQVADDGRRASQAIASVRAMFQDSATRRERIAINPLIREALAIKAEQLQGAAVQVVLDLVEGTPQVLAERNQLQQVLLNLVANAIDAMVAVTTRPRILRIQTRGSEGSDVFVAISDSGGGLSASAVERIFDPFYTTKPLGIGLGLWICRRIIELHDGRLVAAPGAEHGSIFTITLPALRPA